jgi:hypothetical protein
MSEVTVQDIRDMIAPMLKEARERGLWLHCSYQDMWFTPDELEAEQKEGRLCWGPVNWKLRDPRELYESIERRREELEKEHTRLDARFRKWRETER